MPQPSPHRRTAGKSFGAALLAATLALLPGCGAAPPQPDAPLPQAPALALAPRYQVTTHLDPATAGLLGQRTAAALALLEGLEQHPGRTLLAAAELGGLEALTEVRKRLPASLQARLSDWLDQALLDASGGALTGLAAQVGALRELAQVVQVHSQLAFDQPGSAQHQPTGAGFSAGGKTLRLPMPAALAGAVPPPRVEVARPGAGARLSLGPHQFAVPLGKLLLEAAGPLVLRPLGGDTLAQVLVHRAHCPDVAQKLGERCVAGLCLGRVVKPSRLEQLCVGGAQALAARMTRQIEGKDLDLLTFVRGEATLAPGELRDGRWQLQVGGEAAQVEAVAPFAGSAEAVAPAQ